MVLFYTPPELPFFDKLPGRAHARARRLSVVVERHSGDVTPVEGEFGMPENGKAKGPQ